NCGEPMPFCIESGAAMRRSLDPSEALAICNSFLSSARSKIYAICLPDGEKVQSPTEWTLFGEINGCSFPEAISRNTRDRHVGTCGWTRSFPSGEMQPKFTAPASVHTGSVVKCSFAGCETRYPLAISRLTRRRPT